MHKESRTNFILSTGACWRAPISKSLFEPSNNDNNKNNSSSYVLVPTAQYVAKANLFKCEGKNTQSRVFTAGDTVSVIMDPRRVFNPDEKVWIVVRKRKECKKNFALWLRPYDIVLDRLDQSTLRINYMECCIEGTCKAKTGDNNETVECVAVKVIPDTVLWIEKGIYEAHDPGDPPNETTTVILSPTQQIQTNMPVQDQQMQIQTNMPVQNQQMQWCYIDAQQNQVQGQGQGQEWCYQQRLMLQQQQQCWYQQAQQQQEQQQQGQNWYSQDQEGFPVPPPPPPVPFYFSDGFNGNGYYYYNDTFGPNNGASQF